ncbi:MAG: ATP-dependent helicase [Methanosarcina sp.]
MKVLKENEKVRLKVVSEISGISQLIAPAGSGKTATIVSRIVNVLRTDSNAAIAAFAFNNFAADELKLRTRIELKRNSIAYSEHNLFIGTIHQFCFELLTSFFPERADFTILDEMSRFSLISRKSNYNNLALYKLPKLKLPFYLKTRQNTKRVDTIMTFLYTCDLVREESIDIQRCENTPEFKESYCKFLDLLRHQRYYDFSGLLYDAVQLLQGNEGNLKKVLDRYNYFIVDEYQDINTIQEKLIALLAKSGNLLVVGDEDQTIYQFRGSNIENFLNFEKRYACSVNHLRVNYRSSDQLVSVADKVIQFNKSRSSKSIHSNPENKVSSEKGDLIYKVTDNELTELEFICNDIKAKIGIDFTDNNGKQSSLSYRDFAVLVRTNESVSRISRYLKEQGIPIKSTKPGLLIECDEIRYIIDCLIYLLDLIPGFGAYIEDHPLVRMYQDMFDLESFDEDHFSDDYYKRKYTASFAIYDADAFLSNLQGLKTEIEKKKTFNLQDLYHDLLLVIGAFYIEFSYNTSIRLSKFSNVISAFENTNPLINKREIFAFIEFLWGFVMANVDTGEQEREMLIGNSVLISTIHKIKGLEFPVVYLPHLINGVFPSHSHDTLSYLDESCSRNLSRLNVNIEDERRLFYVAITRASKFLCLSYPKKINNRKISPSCFLSEVDLSSFHNEDLTARKANNYPPTVFHKPLILNQGKIRYYLHCPYQYYLRFILGYSPGVPITFGFGSQIHKLINFLHKSYNNNIPTSTEIRKLVDDNFFLRFATEDLFKTLKETAYHILTNYIKNFEFLFSQDTRTEFTFEILLEDSIIRGSIDMICKLDNKETILDFKTDQNQSKDKYIDQLRIYTIACREFYNMNIEQACVMDLRKNEMLPIDVSKSELKKSWKEYKEIIENIINEKFPASPQMECKECDMSRLCSKKPNSLI